MASIRWFGFGRFSNRAWLDERIQVQVTGGLPLRRRQSIKPRRTPPISCRRIPSSACIFDIKFPRNISQSSYPFEDWNDFVAQKLIEILFYEKKYHFSLIMTVHQLVLNNKNTLSCSPNINCPTLLHDHEPKLLDLKDLNFTPTFATALPVTNPATDRTNLACRDQTT